MNSLNCWFQGDIANTLDAMEMVLDAILRRYDSYGYPWLVRTGGTHDDTRE